MSKTKRRATPCKCAEQINEKLKPRGVRLSSEFSINFNTGKATVIHPLLKVEWLDKPKRGKRLPIVTGAYCPVCGKKNK